MAGVWHTETSNLRIFYWMALVHIMVFPSLLLLFIVVIVALSTCLCHMHTDRIKVSDFGLSTVFRHLGKERKLNRRCGTPPYIAPEVKGRPMYMCVHRLCLVKSSHDDISVFFLPDFLMNRKSGIGARD